LDDEVAKKVRLDAIQLKKEKLEAEAVAEQQWIVIAGAQAEAESCLAEGSKHNSTLKQRLEFQTRTVRSWEMRLARLQKDIDEACATICRKCGRK